MSDAFNFKFTIVGYDEQQRSITVRYFTDAIYNGWKPCSSARSPSSPKAGRT
jgi:hypothetical protein